MSLLNCEQERRNRAQVYIASWCKLWILPSDLVLEWRALRVHFAQQGCGKNADM